MMIEDPRDVERRRLLGIDDIDAPTRDELAEALEEVSPMFPLPRAKYMYETNNSFARR